MISYTIKKFDQNKKLHEFIQLFFTTTTISSIKKMINNGNIKVNGKKMFDNYILQENDVVIIYKDIWTINKNYKLTKLNAKIFYEDKNITIIDKEKGILCHEDINEKYNTLNNFLKMRFFKKKIWDGNNKNLEPALVNRIDQNTSGLVLAANNKNVLSLINKNKNNKQIKKVYIAVVHGKFIKKNLEIESYIEQVDKNKMAISHKKNDLNKPIFTIIQSIESTQEFSLVKIIVYNAKKHQIRAQLADLGFPIVGDYKYMNQRYHSPYKSQILVSNEIIFNFNENSKLGYLNKIKFIKNDYSKLNLKDLISKYIEKNSLK